MVYRSSPSPFLQVVSTDDDLIADNRSDDRVRMCHMIGCVKLDVRCSYGRHWIPAHVDVLSMRRLRCLNILLLSQVSFY